MKRMRCAVILAALTVIPTAQLADAEVPDAREFVAHLDGRQEVPVRPTHAAGEAVFQLSADKTALSYQLIVANIENVVAAHIHLGAPGVNGPVVAFLAGNFPPGGGRVNGIIGAGIITSADLVGPLAGMNLSDLVTAMRAGGTYANVHTNDGVGLVNTGPGDFPGGEIRGDIFPAGP